MGEGGGERRERKGSEFLGFGGVVVLVFCDFLGEFLKTSIVVEMKKESLKPRDEANLPLQFSCLREASMR